MNQMIFKMKLIIKWIYKIVLKYKIKNIKINLLYIYKNNKKLNLKIQKPNKKLMFINKNL